MFISHVTTTKAPAPWHLYIATIPRGGGGEKKTKKKQGSQKKKEGGGGGE